MAQPFYQVPAEPKKLRKIARHARSLVSGQDGDPVLALGARRIV